MNTYAKKLKENIFTIISELAKSPGEFTTFDPNAFTKIRKWDFSTIMKFILRFGSNSLGFEIGEFFDYKEGFPTVSSFVQQRKKLKYTAFEQLFHKFNDAVIHKPALFKGYRLLAIDGSEVQIPFNSDESNCYINKHTSKIHIHSLFDLLSKVHMDVMVERNLENDETGRACDMVERLNDKIPCIIVADRNYESYNFFAHVEEKLLDYVVRIKDINRHGILSGMHLPEQDEFDITVRIFIDTKHYLRSKMLSHKYKYISKSKRFDYETGASGYEMIIRLVRFKLSENTYECLATSLSEDMFSVDDLKKIYNQRWGIETAFRELKYIMGISAFHSKQENSILQEVYARLIMYNFSMLITSKVQIKEKNLKNKLQINYTQAIRICQHYFRDLHFEVSYDIETTIKRFLLPVRPGRKYNRITLETDTKNFNYRLA